MRVLALGLLAAVCLASSAGAREQHATVNDPDGFTNLRGEDGQILAKIRVGDPFVLLKHTPQRKSWHVRLPSGLGGYVHESRIRLISKAEAERRQAARLARLPRKVDISVGGFSLLDPDSAERVLGKRLKTVEEDNDFPKAYCLNAARTEQLVLTQHYGALLHEFAEYQVTPVHVEGRGPVAAGVGSWITGRGVRLGMSERELIERLGSPTKTSGRGKDRNLEYRVAPNEGRAVDEILSDWELYYGNYQFREGRLVRFRFGFDYP
ncbi:MAG TPA: hypothetical protein VGO90_10400 [Chthoniobacteraceae bacterium]|nr:hypothetical protein [Chthoniobacteraceae bacterium]